MATNIRLAACTDAMQLHALAAATFPLACPPDTLQSSIDDFIARHLSMASFSAYLADDARRLLLAEVESVPAGYTMIVFGGPARRSWASPMCCRRTTGRALRRGS